MKTVVSVSLSLFCKKASSILSMTYLKFFQSKFKYIKHEIDALWISDRKQNASLNNAKAETTFRIFKHFINENILEFTSSVFSLLSEVETLYNSRFWVKKRKLTNKEKEAIRFLISLFSSFFNFTPEDNSDDTLLIFLPQVFKEHIFQVKVGFDSLSSLKEFDELKFFLKLEEQTKNTNSFFITLFIFRYLLYWGWISFLFDKLLKDIIEDNHFLKQVISKEHLLELVFINSLKEFLSTIKPEVEKLQEKLIYTYNLNLLESEIRLFEYFNINKIFQKLVRE